jgi:hypothetical protein
MGARRDGVGADIAGDGGDVVRTGRRALSRLEIERKKERVGEKRRWALPLPNPCKFVGQVTRR